MMVVVMVVMVEVGASERMHADGRRGEETTTECLMMT